MTVPSLQLLWGADEEKKRQCVFKGKDPQVSPAGRAAGAGSALCAAPAGVVAEPCPPPAEGLSQLHQDAAAAEQHPPLHLRDLRLQPRLRLHCEHGEGAGGPCGAASPRGGRWAPCRAHSPVPVQNVQHFSLERDASGRVLLEDGKGRCPFDPEYRSTAVMVGKARAPLACAAGQTLAGHGQPRGERVRVRAGSQQEPLPGRW